MSEVNFESTPEQIELAAKSGEVMNLHLRLSPASAMEMYARWRTDLVYCKKFSIDQKPGMSSSFVSFISFCAAYGADVNEKKFASGEKVMQGASKLTKAIVALEPIMDRFEAITKEPWFTAIPLSRRNQVVNVCAGLMHNAVDLIDGSAVVLDAIEKFYGLRP